jgi:hypothetical protein
MGQSDAPRHQVTAEINGDLRRLFKAKVALDGTTMQAKMVEWITEYAKDMEGR